MPNMDVFAAKDYKFYLKSCLLGAGSRGRLSRAAEMLKCQPSFLSRVIKTEAHITPDQAFLLTKFLDLSPNEADYFQTLVLYERASDPEYRSHLASRAVTLRQAHDDLRNKMKKQDYSGAGGVDQAVYFSSWATMAVHFLTSVPAFQTSAAMAGRLGLPESSILPILQSLERSGFVKHDRKTWRYERGQFHLPKDSPFVVFLHQNWRARAVLNSQNAGTESVHFTNVFTLSKSDYARIRDLLLHFISEANKIGSPSKPEEGVALTCDFFKF